MNITYRAYSPGSALLDSKNFDDTKSFRRSSGFKGPRNVFSGVLDNFRQVIIFETPITSPFQTMGIASASCKALLLSQCSHPLNSHVLTGPGGIMYLCAACLKSSMVICWRQFVISGRDLQALRGTDLVQFLTLKQSRKFLCCPFCILCRQGGMPSIKEIKLHRDYISCALRRC